MTTIIGEKTKKFGVLIGINYVGTTSELNGCINDALHLKTLLIEQCGYSSENLVLITDEESIKPTKQNIIDSFNTLLQKANEGYEELWLSYSGHGSYLSDYSGDEKDGRDEILCPVDYATSGFITDDYIYENFVSKLPGHVTLFSLMDCCHSGTVLDLPFLYSNTLESNNTNKCEATVICISGCRDNQTSADAYINNDYEGAMTWSFLNALSQVSYNTNLLNLVERMRMLLQNKYTQIPMLSVSSSEDIDKIFIQKEVDADPSPGVKSVKIIMTVDRWYRESYWNLFSDSELKYVFKTSNGFTEPNQTTITNVNLPHGKYLLIVGDTYGDGGVKVEVVSGLVTLLSANMNTGRYAKYYFTIQ
jgi:hypothetical protein